MEQSHAEFASAVLTEAMRRSEQIGRSDIGVYVYPADGWTRAFRRAFHIRSFHPAETGETLLASLSDWLGTEPAEQAATALSDRFGAPVAVLRAENEPALLRALSSSERGFGAFYTTEDVFFAAFDDCVLAFIMGNFD